VSSYLGDRARRGHVKAEPKQAVVPPTRLIKPLDPLEMLATRVRLRLGDIALGWPGPVEVDHHSPYLAHYNQGTIVLGDVRRLANFVRNPKLIDLLVAHVVTVLDVSLTEITSSSQATAVYKLLQAQ
jgi:hypothetical protein